MKEFNGSVVIIDPAKFALPGDLGTKIDTKLTRISPKLGFRGYLFTSLGRDSMFLYQYKVDDVREYYKVGIENWVKTAIGKAFNGELPPVSVNGQVSVDSGSVGVFLLSDIEKYNPNWMEGYKKGLDFILIPGYRGKIGFIRDKYGIIHLFGTGNNNFYTL